VRVRGRQLFFSSLLKSTDKGKEGVKGKRREERKKKKACPCLSSKKRGRSVGGQEIIFFLIEFNRGSKVGGGKRKNN